MEELHRSLGRVEGKLDALIASAALTLKDHEHLELRVSSVEKKVWYSSGLAAATAFLLGMLTKYLPFFPVIK
jgi:hypothetical protein